MSARRYSLSALVCAMLLALSTDSWAALFRVVSGGLERQQGVMVAREQGAVIALSNGVTLRVAPGSRLYRVHKRVRLWLSNEGRTMTHVIALQSGQVEVDNRTGLKRAVMVRAPQKVASVLREGRMSVVATDEQVSLANHGGSVLVAVGAGKFTGLSASTVRTLTDVSDSSTQVLGAARVSMAHSLYGGFGRSADLEGVTWGAIEGAVEYRVNVAQLAPEHGAIRHFKTQMPVLAPAPRLPAGRYELTVQAVDRFGIAGVVSEPSTFSVVGVKTSDGGYVDGRGNIVAGYDRRVQLTFAGGLVMKGGHTDWHPVPDEIVLSDDQPINLHVREAGDTRMVSTRVMPHAVRTTVVVGPKFLRWPGDAAHLEVSIADEAGQANPVWVQPAFRVLLGIDELEVEWEKRGDSFVAEVPPQPGEGPWIVRVEVEDQYGHSLGRDFVEIAPKRVPARPVPPPKSPAQASR